MSHRVTRTCLLSQLHPELRQALLDYARAHGLETLDPDATTCYETTSMSKNAGRLPAWLSASPDATTRLAILLTPDRLVWARWGDRSGTRVTAAELKDIRVKVYASPLARDAGLEVSGYLEGSQGRVKGYIGLESVTIAQEFCRQVRQAIDLVNPPQKRRFPRWFGG